MAGFVLHVAVAVLIASLFRLQRGTKYIVVAITLLPVVTPLTVRQVGWVMATLAPEASLSTRAAVAWLLAPGGGMETVAAALVVGLIGLLATVRPRARTWRPRIGLALASGWAAFIVVELIGPGTVRPFWPLSPVAVDFALVETNAPLFLILSLFYLLGEGMADAWRWDKARARAEAVARGEDPEPLDEDGTSLYVDHDPDHQMGHRTRLVLRKFGPRLAKGAYRFGGIVLVFLAIVKVAGAAGAPVTLHGMMPDTFPQWTEVTVGDGGQAYHVAAREPFQASEGGRVVPVMPAGLSEAQQAQAERALCLAGRMGPVMDLHHPVVLSVSGGVVIVAEAHQVRDGTLDEPGTGWMVAPHGGSVTVGPSDGHGRMVWRTPVSLVEASGCV